MSYTLAQAIADLKASQIHFSKRQFRVSLIGDPFGTVYTVPDPPVSIVNGITVYTSSASLSSASYTFDYDSGTLVLTSGSINSPLTATYTAQEFSDATLMDICIRAMDFMELAWPRGFAWSTTASTGKVSMYSGSSLVDAVVPGPPSGDFGDSRSEIGLLVAASLIGLTEARLSDAAAHFFLFKGGVGGVTIDKSLMAKHLNTEAARLLDGFKKSIYAQQQYWTTNGGAAGGGWIGMPQTLDYEANFEWQSANRGRMRPDYGVNG